MVNDPFEIKSAIEKLIESNTKINIRISNIEQHIINLIFPLQCIKDVAKILGRPIPIDDRAINNSLDIFERFIKKIIDDLYKIDFSALSKIQENFKDINTTLNEIKFIGKKVNDIQIELKKINEEGLTKKVKLDFSCDGYELVKRTLDYQENDLILKSQDNYLRELLNTLTHRESQVLIHRLGLFDEKGKTYDAIGKIFNITKEPVRQIYNQALRKLRHTSRKEKLCYVKEDKLLKVLYSK